MNKTKEQNERMETARTVGADLALKFYEDGMIYFNNPAEIAAFISAAVGVIAQKAGNVLMLAAKDPDASSAEVLEHITKNLETGMELARPTREKLSKAGMYDGL